MNMMLFPRPAAEDIAEGGDRVARLRSLAIDRGAPVGRAVAAPGRRHWLFAVIGVQALVIGGLALGGMPKLPGLTRAAPAAAAPPVVKAAPRAAAIAGVQFEAQGFVTATRRATVSTRVAGIVTSVNVEAGDRVTRGQVLGTLDADLATRDLALAERQIAVLAARLRSADAQTRQADADLQRETPLFERQFSTRARHLQLQTASEVAVAARDSARADLSVAGLQVQQQRSMVGNYTIRAPFAGIVIEKNAQPGELIAPSGAGGGFTRTGLCTIVDMDSLEIVVDVNEQLVTRVRPGQPVSISLYAYPDAKFPGRISRIMPSADRAKGTLQVRIRIDRADPRILPDMGARVAFL